MAAVCAGTGNETILRRPLPMKQAMPLNTLDKHLLALEAKPGLAGARRFALEFLYFGIKQARACLFVFLFFAAVFSSPARGHAGRSAL